MITSVCETDTNTAVDDPDDLDAGLFEPLDRLDDDRLDDRHGTDADHPETEAFPPVERRYRRRGAPRVEPDPTPAEIRRACLAIQRTWTHEERQKRSSGCERVAWNVPGARSTIGEPCED